MYSVIRNKELIEKTKKVYSEWIKNVASVRKLCIKHGLKETDYYRIKREIGIGTNENAKGVE